MMLIFSVFFFFQAEDGIRDAQESRGLGDVYKRQILYRHPSTSRTLSLNLLNMSMRTPIVHAYLEAAKIKVPRRGDKAAAVERPPNGGSGGGRRGGGAGGDARRNHISDETFDCSISVSYTNLRDHENPEHLVCRLLLEKKNINKRALSNKLVI
eukprot:TRINITY_DN7759_c0_g1_i2.p1 TRINITY_DN7759_c0_g1~~TRINITY_DN7759_c0_g1_i2.p1  ORF type:complete len:154 (-),score=30.83 TRINITY_DN7759_c0_g1_i2:6-467(-)